MFLDFCAAAGIIKVRFAGRRNVGLREIKTAAGRVKYIGKNIFGKTDGEVKEE